jgi:hypothetical protein
MEDVGIYYGHLIYCFVYFVAIWYILWLFDIFFPFWYVWTEINLATLGLAHFAIEKVHMYTPKCDFKEKNGGQCLYFSLHITQTKHFESIFTTALLCFP